MKKQKTNKKNQKPKIVMMIAIVTMVLIIAINHKSDFEQELKKLINEVNELNKIFEKIDINDSTKYVASNGFICYKSDEKNIDKIKKLYVNPFVYNGNFNIVYSGDDKEEKLYICLKENCKVKKIKKYNIVNEKEIGDIVENYSDIGLISNDNNTKLINIYGENYVITKVDNKWKFNIPVVICEN